MKVFSTLITLTCFFGKANILVNAEEYFDKYNVATEGTDCAFCLQETPGCLGVDPSTARCKAPVSIGSISDIETDKSQKWIYKDGMIQNKISSTSSSSSSSYWPSSMFQNKQYGCLGPRYYTYKLIEDEEYPLIRRQCPCGGQIPQYMQFVMTHDGFIQSLAPVVKASNKNGRTRMLQSQEDADEEEEDEVENKPTPFCITINEVSTMIEEDIDVTENLLDGASVTLKACNFDDTTTTTASSRTNPLSQKFVSFGYRSPLLQSTQDIYGKEDTISIAYDLGTNTDGDDIITFSSSSQQSNKIVIIDLYRVGRNYYDQSSNEVVHTIEEEVGTTSSGVVTLDVSTAGLVDGYYKAIFSQGEEGKYYSTVFKINTSEDHITNGYTDTYYSDDNSFEGYFSVGIIFALVFTGTLLFIGFCLTCRKCNVRKTPRNAFTSGTTTTAITHGHDDDDDVTVNTTGTMDGVLEEKGINASKDGDDGTIETRSQSSHESE